MYRIFIAIAILLVGGVVVVAQGEDPLYVLFCETDAGCTRQVSPLTIEEVTILVGEEPPETEFDTYVVCIADGVCGWGHIPTEDVDLLFGGDGIEDREFEDGEDPEDDEMTFTEEEVFGDETTEDDGMTFTEEELEAFDEAICGGDDCLYVPVDEDDFAILFDPTTGDGIQPLDGVWYLAIDEMNTNCPLGMPDVMSSDTQSIDFSEPFVVQDVLNASGVPGISVTYTNNPNTNTYIAVLDTGDGVTLQYLYRVIREDYLVGNIYMNLDFASCSFYGTFHFERQSD